MTLTPETASPLALLHKRIADLEDLRDRVDVELAAARGRLNRIHRRQNVVDRAKVPPGTATADVRAWGRANGWTVGDRGRMPAALVDAYMHRHRQP